MRISDWSSDVGSSDLSGGSWGANSSTAGLYAACEQLRAQIAQKAGFNIADVEFADGQVRSGNRTAALRDVAAPDGLTVEGGIEFGDLDKKFAQASFGAHFCEVGVAIATAEVRVRRLLSVCAAGRDRKSTRLNSSH